LFAITLLGIYVVSPLSGPSFFGLEYEDAFEYAYAGALLALAPASKSGGLNPICLSGAMLNCEAIGFLSHPIGLSVLVSWLNTSFGWSAHYVQWLSAVASLSIAIGLFFSAQLLGMGAIGATSSALLFLTTPAFAALTSSGFAEPLAAALLLYAISLTTWNIRELPKRAARGSAGNALLRGSALSLVIALAANVRRENLLLGVALPMMCALCMRAVPRGARHSHFSWLVAACLGGLVLAEVANSSGLHSRQAVSVSSTEPPFSIHNFGLLVPAFLSYLADWQRWFGLPVAVVLGVIEGRRRQLLLVPIGISAVYLGAFLSFSQSWYFTHRGEVPWLHFERYTLEIAPCLALVGGSGIESVWVFLRRRLPGFRFRAALVVLGISGVTTGLVLGGNLKRDYANEEAEVRVRPIVLACEEIPTHGALVAVEPILVSLFCGPTRRVVAYPALGSDVDGESLRLAEQTGGLYLLENELTLADDAIRYPRAANVLSTMHRKLVRTIDSGRSRYRLYQIRPSSAP
jgi:hypothetical protein